MADVQLTTALAAASDVVAGAEFTVTHPFCWDLASRPSGDPEGPYSQEFMSWRPGVRYELLPPYGDSEAIADGNGAQVLTVVSVHKPGRFPARVFYTRRWIDPRGQSFGKGALRIKIVSAFRRLVRGYRDEYRLATGQELIEHEREERAKSLNAHPALPQEAA